MLLLHLRSLFKFESRILQSSKGHRFKLSPATNNCVEHETSVSTSESAMNCHSRIFFSSQKLSESLLTVCMLTFSSPGNFSNWKYRMDKDVAFPPHFSQTQCKVNKRFLLTYCWEIAFRKLFLTCAIWKCCCFCLSLEVLNCHLQVASLKRQSSSKCSFALNEFFKTKPFRASQLMESEKRSQLMKKVQTKINKFSAV